MLHGLHAHTRQQHGGRQGLPLPAVQRLLLLRLGLERDVAGSHRHLSRRQTPAGGTQPPRSTADATPPALYCCSQDRGAPR